MRILIAEDDRATRLRLQTLVAQWGHDVVAGKDGEEAWALFGESAFDCVISDWMMPGLTGIDVVKRIREAQSREQSAYVYLLLLTSQTEKERLVEGMEAGADDFVTKPFDTEELRVRIRAGQRIVDLERRLAERNRELSTFTSVASHDLREPLRTISSFLGLLQRKYQGKLDAQADEYIGFVLDGATRMRHLITDLLAYARFGSSEETFAPVDLNQLVDEKLQLLGRSIEESQARITCQPLPSVEGDRTQLSQLLQNLIGNGIKYREQDAQPAIEIQFDTDEQADAYVFSVSDDGIGIPEEHREAVFEPFRRLHGTGGPYSGSGVGLSICRKVIERHGGRIWIEPNQPRGTRFLFTLPRPKPPNGNDA